MQKILIKGGGITALVAGWELTKKQNYAIDIAAPQSAPMGSASWYAGGMLAPYCERESSEALIQTAGITAIDWWQENFPNLVSRNGTLVLATNRDLSELERFAAQTEQHSYLNGQEIAKLEPDLEGRFDRALFYKDEAYLNPRQVLVHLKEQLVNKGTNFINPLSQQIDKTKYSYIITATGIDAKKNLEQLRGVRGEMLLVKCEDIKLSRSIRLLHPRIPLYIVPRPNSEFMIGATMIESDSVAPITARSMMELLSAAYALHPAFGNGTIIESNVGVRAAFPDNLPRIDISGKYISINGLYRHGYLLSPYLAQQLAQLLQ